MFGHKKKQRGAPDQPEQIVEESAVQEPVDEPEAVAPDDDEDARAGMARDAGIASVSDDLWDDPPGWDSGPDIGDGPGERSLDGDDPDEPEPDMDDGDDPEPEPKPEPDKRAGKKGKAKKEKKPKVKKEKKPKPPKEKSGRKWGLPGRKAPEPDAADEPEPIDPEPEEPDEPDTGDGGMEDIAGSMASAGTGRKPRKPKKPKPERPERQGQNPIDAIMAMDEPKRQAVFTAGCVTAGICAVLLIIIGTVFACRMFGARPSPAIAADLGNGIYYDESGKMHVNVHITREPDTQVTVYVLPDGSVTTEKPPESQSEGVKTIILYVDSEGNISDTPPEKTDTANPPQESREPETTTLYLDEAGNLTAHQPDTGLWKRVDVTVGNDGKVSVEQGDGEMAGWEREPLELWITSDGKVLTEDPGDGSAGKATVSLNEDGTASVEQEPARSEPQGDTGSHMPNRGEWSYLYKDEAEILAEAEKRRQEGKSWYLDTDRVYIVKRGDTLSYLSGRLGFSVDFLAMYNNIADKNLIITGESLRYPAID